jgi:hypothetical protein
MHRCNNPSVRQRLTDEWSIELDGEYLSRLIDNNLQLVAPGRTIWIAVWKPSADQAPEAMLEGIKRELPNPNPDGRVEEWSDDRLEVRYASWYPEPGDRGVQYSLYGYTIRRGSYVQMALISDSPKDTDWALTTWRSLAYDFDSGA